MASYEDCKGGKSRVNDRLVFIAAYNMYRRAWLGDKASQAKAQFPSMEEIFNENLEVGESLNTGCWINENVTLSKREWNLIFTILFQVYLFSGSLQKILP